MLKSLPLVSILIPTYNRPELFQKALDSALAQTYPNIEILIGDDSTDDRTERLVASYERKTSNIKYIHHPKNLGQFENDLVLMKRARGEYVNFLMDDDLFHPTKIERMMAYFLSDKGRQITLVTSHRQVIDETGAPVEDAVHSEKFLSQDAFVPGHIFADFILSSNLNVLGEPTTVLFRKADLHEPFGTLSGRRYICNVDLASWFNLLSRGSAVYLADTLSYYRIHSEQQQNHAKIRIGGYADYAHSLLEARKMGFLRDDEKYRKAFRNGARSFSSALHRYQPFQNEAPEAYQELSSFVSEIRKILTKIIVHS